MDGPVLLSGERGTGRGFFARIVHFHSRRSAELCVPVICAGVPERRSSRSCSEAHAPPKTRRPSPIRGDGAREPRNARPRRLRRGGGGISSGWTGSLPTRRWCWYGWNGPGPAGHPDDCLQCGPRRRARARGTFRRRCSRRWSPGSCGSPLFGSTSRTCRCFCTISSRRRTGSGRNRKGVHLLGDHRSRNVRLAGKRPGVAGSCPRHRRQKEAGNDGRRHGHPARNPLPKSAQASPPIIRPLPIKEAHHEASVPPEHGGPDHVEFGDLPELAAGPGQGRVRGQGGRAQSPRHLRPQRPSRHSGGPPPRDGIGRSRRDRVDRRRGYPGSSPATKSC